MGTCVSVDEFQSRQFDRFVEKAKKIGKMKPSIERNMAAASLLKDIPNPFPDGDDPSRWLRVRRSLFSMY